MSDWAVVPVLGVLDVFAAVDDPVNRRLVRAAVQSQGEPKLFAKEITNVDARAAELVDRDLQFLRPVQDEPYGMRDFTVETPDGLRLLFAMPL